MAKPGKVEESPPFRGVGGAFNRGDDERHDLDPTDWYIVKDGKMLVASIYPRQTQQAIAQGFSRTRAEAKSRDNSQGVAEAAKWRTQPDAHDLDTDGSYIPKGGIKSDNLAIRQKASKTQSEKDPKSMAGMFGAKYAKKHGVPTKQLMKNIPLGDKKPYPNTWHDVDPKLGKQVDNMSPEEKVKKGYANPSILKKNKQQGVAEGFNGEYDDEAGMADNNLETLRRAVDGIDNVINTGDNLPEWCQEKIAVAKSMLVTVWDYMRSEEQIEDPEIAEMYEAMQLMAESMAHKHRVSVDLVWESFEALDDHMLYETAAWRRKEGKSAKGGLNAKGVASYRRENPGSKLQTAVTTKPSKLEPGSKAAKRRKSFCARMSGVKGPAKKPNGKPTRKTLALRKWNC